jgi:hypothetical protein
MLQEYVWFQLKIAETISLIFGIVYIAKYLYHMLFTSNLISRFLILLLCASAFIVPQKIFALVETYPATPLQQVDDRITGVAEGKNLVFEKHTTWHPDKPDRLNSTRVRFAASGPVHVQLHFNVPISSPKLRTPTQDLPVQLTGQDLLMYLPGPGHYMLKVGGIGEFILLWVDDANKPQPKPGDPGVVDITSQGVQPNAPQLQTAQIQAAINNCPDNCILYFPPGIYRTGRLRINRNYIRLHFAAGTLLKGSENRCDYGTDDCRGGQLIHIDGTDNIQLTGRGTLDASGPKTYNGGDKEVKIHNMDVDGSHDILIEDLLFMDSNSWGIHIDQTDNVTVKNVKVFSGKDGIDPDSAINVTLDTVFIQSIDDSVAVKARNSVTRNITTKNCMVQSRATALKIGTEVESDITNVLFDSCMIFHSDRYVNLNAKASGDGHISNAREQNIRGFGNLDTGAYNPVGTVPPLTPPPTPTPAATTTPVPLQKTCSVQRSSSQYTADQTPQITVTASSSRTSQEPVGLYLKRQDNARMTPPAGTIEQTYQGHYYYKLSQAPCQVGGGTTCNVTEQLPTLPVGDYHVFCDVSTQPNQCSGNPNCQENGGTINCSALNFSSCSGTDWNTFHIVAGSTPTKPGDVDKDGDVDIFDYNKILQFYGQTNCSVNLVNTCLIDIFDYNAVLTNFGR